MVVCSDQLCLHLIGIVELIHNFEDQMFVPFPSIQSFPIDFLTVLSVVQIVLDVVKDINSNDNTPV